MSETSGFAAGAQAGAAAGGAAGSGFGGSLSAGLGSALGGGTSGQGGGYGGQPGSSNGVLTLGNITFSSFSVPERITHGVKQQLTIHRMPGGDRVIDTMGVDEPPISWSGLLLGSGAQAGRAALAGMIADGRPVPLAWGNQYRIVVVESADFESKDGSPNGDHGSAQISYRITCQIIPPASDDGSEDPWAYGDGETPGTPMAAKDAGQGAATKAQKVAPRIPVPPIPPSTIPARGGGAAP